MEVILKDLPYRAMLIGFESIFPESNIHLIGIKVKRPDAETARFTINSGVTVALTQSRHRWSRGALMNVARCKVVMTDIEEWLCLSR